MYLKVKVRSQDEVSTDDRKIENYTSQKQKDELEELNQEDPLTIIQNIKLSIETLLNIKQSECSEYSSNMNLDD